MRGADPRAQRAFRWLLATRQDDGGWAIPFRTRRIPFSRFLDVRRYPEPVPPDRTQPSSHLVSGMVLRAFSAHPVRRRSPAARTGAELLAARLYRRDAYGDRRDRTCWDRVGFPFWFTDVVSALDSLSRIGVAAEVPHLRAALERSRRGGPMNVREAHPARRIPMTTAPLALPRAARIACLLVLGMGAPGHAGLAEPPTAASPALGDEAYLDRLVGHWRMEGTVRGKAVAYRAEGARVLQGAFLRLHLIDVAEPPQYEAEVFIGVDAKAHDFVAHWLDRFGGAGARVVATGHREGMRLILTFPYVEGTFRDTFTLEPRSGTWTLLLEAQAASGAWSTFARYTLAPAPRP